MSRAIAEPLHLLALALAFAPILSLLLYFYGVMSMPKAFAVFGLPAMVLLPVLTAVASRRTDRSLARRISCGVWAGGFATLAYDLVRVPVAHSGVPVFKAISYFGTVLMATSRPTLTTELVGWSYHFATGVGFALAYLLLVGRPGWLSAVTWGVSLEGLMLITPYAEVFGYRRSAGFFAITVGAHIVYGLGLCAAARYYLRSGDIASDSSGTRRSRIASMTAVWLLGPALLGLVAADFHRLHASSIPASPPPYIGRDLYVSWSTPEFDRIGSIWLMKRFVNPRARFHFIEPMSEVRYGTPFDLPEAEIRRHVNQSTFQVVMERAGLQKDPAIQPLARMCYMMEVRPWAMSASDEERRLAQRLADRIGDCRALDQCLDAGVAWFDEVYREYSSAASPAPR